MNKLIQRFLSLFKKPMANIEMKPIKKENLDEVLMALANYKKQNPVKYEQKKEALFAKYGIQNTETVEEEVEQVEAKLEKAPKKKLNIV